MASALRLGFLAFYVVSILVLALKVLPAAVRNPPPARRPAGLARHLLHRGAEHEVRDLDDETAFLGEADELLGVQQTVFGMLPTHERLGTLENAPLRA